MKVKIHLLSLLLVSILLQNCIYDFNPDNNDYENNLVVRGLITNELKPIVVHLSRTISISSNEPNPETGASVLIYSMSGDVIQLYEIEAGIYSSIYERQGVVGESYSIQITTSDYKVYKSDYQKIEEPVSVSGMSYEYFYKETTDIEKPLWGCEIYVDVDLTDSPQKYIRMDMEETWLIQLPLRASHFFDPSLYQLVPVNLSRLCWRYDIPSEFHVLNTADYGSKKINKFPLRFVSNRSSRLYWKYCLKVNLYSISESAYAFWKAQGENAGSNSLYSTQPYRVSSNIKNISDPDEVVIGFFEAAGTSFERIFISDNPIDAAFELSYCEYERTQPYPEERISGYYMYITREGSYVVDDECVLCEATGATSEKPDFWED